MAQESGWARRQPVSAGLEDDHEIADLGLRQFRLVGQEVERGAEATDDARCLGCGRAHAIADRDRVVAPDHLAEIPRRRELMVETAIGHEKNLAARDFPVDDARDIEATLADDITP